MTYKETLTIHKPWFQTGLLRLSPAGLFARLTNAIKIEIPEGYQDETGFHSGVKAPEKEMKWPPTW